MTFEEKLWFLREYATQRRVPILSKEKAKWLEEFIAKLKPKTVLEIGCAIGYSTSILGHNGARVVSVDASLPAIQQATEFTQFFVIDVEFICSDGLEYLKNETKCFDCVFIDFQKSYYKDAFVFAKKLLNQNGVLIFDNAWHSKTGDFVKWVLNQKEYEVTQVLIGDGFLVCKLKS